MGKDQLIAFFNSIVTLKDEDEALIRSLMTTIRVPARSYLFQEGEVNHSIYFVVKGCARIGFNHSNGEDISCYFAQENEWISVYESFLTGEPAEYFIQTIEDCELLVADRMGVEAIFTKVSMGNVIGRKMTEALFISTIQRLTDFYKYTPEERFQRFIEAYPKLANRIPQQCVASYIGVKPQSLSRIKKRVFSAE